MMRNSEGVVRENIINSLPPARGRELLFWFSTPH